MPPTRSPVGRGPGNLDQLVPHRGGRERVRSGHGERAGGGARGRGAHGAHLQPRPRLLPGPRRHQARPGRVLPGGRTGDRERAAGAAVHAAPVPQGRRRRQGPPEAGARRCPAVARDGAGVLPPLRAARRRAVRDRAGPGDLGRADVDRRVPPVELASGPRRAARRVAHRPRPDARLPARPGAPGRPRRARGARRARRRGLAQDLGGQRPARLRAHPARARLRRRPPGRARLRP